MNDNWKHCPDSPWGNIDICIHGCTRDHTELRKPAKVCIECDYPVDANIHLDESCECSTGATWHLDECCLSCFNPVPF